MSWFVSFHARNKTAAVKRVMAEREINTHFPPVIADALVASINWLPDSPGKLLAVTTSGSAYADGGTCTSTVQLVEFAE